MEARGNIDRRARSSRDGPSRRVRQGPISCRSVPAASTLDRSIMPATRTDVRDPRGRRVDRAGRREAPCWERRYEVVRPRRHPNGYRAYRPMQVALLRAFARLIDDGERIGDLAGRPREEVLARAQARALDGTPQAALLDAVAAFDRERLEGLVAQQLALRGLRAFATEIVLPLAQSVGDLWALGKIPIAAEHLASEVVLHALKGGLRLSVWHGTTRRRGLPRRRAPRVGLRHTGRDPGRWLARALSRRRPSRPGGGGSGVDARAEGRRPERQRPRPSCGSTFRRSRPSWASCRPGPWPSSAAAAPNPLSACCAGTGSGWGSRRSARPATS